MHPGEKVVTIRGPGYIRVLTLEPRSPSDRLLESLDMSPSSDKLSEEECPPERLRPPWLELLPDILHRPEPL